MKKLSSKIIISLLLATFLWGGVSVDFNKDKNIKINTVTTIVLAADSHNSELREYTLYDRTLGRLFGVPWRVADNATVMAEQVKGGISQWFLDGALWIFLQIIYLFLIVANYLAALSGNLLDVAVDYSIFRIGSYGQIKDAIEIIWSSVRDLLNITFIFVLLWVSIKTILGLSGANTKKMITSVIVAALLINFSLFISRIVIDAGNYTAVAVYNTSLNNDVQNIEGDTGEQKKYISGALLTTTGISSAYEQSKDALKEGASSDVFVILIFKLILASIVFWAFMSAAWLFIVRIVVFIILMSLSPIGFVGEIIPYLKPYAEKWWNTLFNQTLVAPVFLFFIFITLKMARSAGFYATTPASQIDVSSYFQFAMVISLLIAAVKVTKKLSGEAGATLTKLGSAAIGGVTGLALGVATGGAALAGRQVLGRMAASALEGEKGAKLRASAAAGNVASRAALATLERGKNASYDLRNTRAMGFATGQLNRATGINVNTGKPGSWSSVAGLDRTVAASREEQEKKEIQEYNRLNSSITNRQRLDANAARVRRDDLVDDELEGTIDPQTGLRVSTTVTTQAGLDYQRMKQEKKAMLAVADNHRDLQLEQAGFQVAEDELNRAQATGDQAQINKAQKELNEAKRIKDKKIKEIQEEIKKKRAGEIAQLDEDMKAIRTKAERHHESNLTPDEQSKLAIVNQARNYADSIRSGRLGHNSVASMTRSGSERNARLADRMENQRS